MDIKEKILPLKEYFLKRDEIVMAFLFGSFAKGSECVESDVDVAVFFKSDENGLWPEYEKEYPCEGEIWGDVEKIIGKETDLLILNRASPTIAEQALKGIPIVVKDRKIFMNFFLRITSEATDYREWVESYWRFKNRGKHVIRDRG